MKKFDKSIMVEISLDSVAHNLLSKMDKSVIADTIVETIIETIPLEKIQYLYNVLNGFSNEINIKIGDMFYCNHLLYHPYHPVVKNENRKDHYMPVGNCIVTDVNLYSSEKVQIECDFWTKNGVQKERFWVRHQSLEVYREEEPNYEKIEVISE